MAKEGKKKKGLKQANEDLLFGDTGDIFADLPVTTAETKKKKVTKKKGAAKKVASASTKTEQEKDASTPTNTITNEEG